MKDKYQELFNRQEFTLSESESIDFLVKRKGKNGNFFLRYLTDFVTPDLDTYFEIKGLYIGINLLRKEFGFDKNEKPGDFDLIIIPYNENKIIFERTGACEVKVVRPTRKTVLKNANSLGRTQLNGLIKDGFPFVGLIHLSMSEPLKDFEKVRKHFKKNELKYFKTEGID